MFCILDRFDGWIFGRGMGGGGKGHIYPGAYIWDVNWVKYLGGVYSEGGLIDGERINRKSI